jgi:hypothetical protein
MLICGLPNPNPLFEREDALANGRIASERRATFGLLSSSSSVLLHSDISAAFGVSISYAASVDRIDLVSLDFLVYSPGRSIVVVRYRARAQRTIVVDLVHECT